MDGSEAVALRDDVAETVDSIRTVKVAMSSTMMGLREYVGAVFASLAADGGGDTNHVPAADLFATSSPSLIHSWSGQPQSSTPFPTP